MNTWDPNLDSSNNESVIINDNITYNITAIGNTIPNFTTLFAVMEVQPNKMYSFAYNMGTDTTQVAYLPCNIQYIKEYKNQSQLHKLLEYNNSTNTMAIALAQVNDRRFAVLRLCNLRSGTNNVQLWGPKGLKFIRMQDSDASYSTDYVSFTEGVWNGSKEIMFNIDTRNWDKITFYNGKGDNLIDYLALFGGKESLVKNTHNERINSQNEEELNYMVNKYSIHKSDKSIDIHADDEYYSYKIEKHVLYHFHDNEKVTKIDLSNMNIKELSHNLAKIMLKDNPTDVQLITGFILFIRLYNWTYYNAVSTSDDLLDLVKIAKKFYEAKGLSYDW